MKFIFQGAVKFLCYFAITLAILAAFIGIPKTAALASTASTTIGTAFGITIGSIPDFAGGITDGQKAMDKGAAQSKKG